MSDAMEPESGNYLIYTLAMITCLVLLINVSFKIIELHGFMFSAGSVLCSLVVCLYLLVLKECDLIQQRQVLNKALLALYCFSIGVYLLVNLPAAEYMRDQSTYQIVFDDIPKKFFAATLAFGISFYLPHLLCFSTRATAISQKKKFLLALLGGSCFFPINFYLLFSDSMVKNYYTIYGCSLIVAAITMVAAGMVYRITMKPFRHLAGRFYKARPRWFSSHWYHYLISFAVIILLICLSCEYRLISFSDNWTLSASGIFFPMVLLASNLVGELYGLKANLYMTGLLILTELVFDGLLMGIIVLPSPAFFDLNPYYSFIMPQRLPASMLALLVTFATNALLLEKLKSTAYGSHRGLRMLIANLIVNSLLSMVNYSLLFSEIYPYEQVINLAVNAWVYKFIFILLGMPVVLYLYGVLNEKKLHQPVYLGSRLVRDGHEQHGQR